MRSRFVWVSIILSVIGAGPLAAQQQPAAISPSPNAPATLTRLTLEQAREMALANNKKLQLGRMNLDEKGVAVSAATVPLRCRRCCPNGTSGSTRAWAWFTACQASSLEERPQYRDPPCASDVAAGSSQIHEPPL